LETAARFLVASDWLARASVSRADSRPTIVNEIAGLRLVLDLLPKTIIFKGDAVLDLVEHGLYRKHRRKS